MKLSELNTGQCGVIVKVLGHGGFRKRIVEMGFIKGKKVEVLLNAPFQDPVKYRIMGYEISLRRDEADMIEIVGEEEALPADGGGQTTGSSATQLPAEEIRLRQVAKRRRRIINVALVGNPNCGKTSLFNFASGSHEHVGNYSGVTVDAKVGTAEFEGYEFHLVDLPGTYSLTAYSPEELYVREQIIEQTPDIVINVIDASNIERNLYLTAGLVDMNVRMVCALNMYDEFERRGDQIDLDTLGRLFGVPMIPTVFKTGRGVDLLFHIIINMYEGVDFIGKDGQINPEVAAEIQSWHRDYEKAHGGCHGEDFAHGAKPNNSVYRHIHLNHGQTLESSIEAIKAEFKNNEEIRHKYSTRYLSIKLLEKDPKTLALVGTLPNEDELLAIAHRERARVKKETGEDAETAVMDAKYAFIHGALQEACFKEGVKQDTYSTTHTLDALITNRVVGFPIFLMIIYVMFQATFTLGSYPMDLIQFGVDCLRDLLTAYIPAGMLKDMIIDGIVSGIGSVIVFLPQILIMYAFISFMEDCGYMARAAFIMDKLMHKIGLHGKSFIPLIMGFGCNVPAVMATRAIESRRSRLITMMVLPLMSCSARLPIYVMICGAFFAVRYQAFVMISLYAIGVALAALTSRVLSKYVVKGDDTPFVMELPPYRFPTTRAIMRHTWEKGLQYLKKMGGVILVASIIVWALGYFPHNDALSPAQQQEQSYIGRIGKAMEPSFRAQGFDWRLDVSLVAGIGAKEIVASSLGVLYSEADAQPEQVSAKAGDVDSPTPSASLYDKMTANGMTTLTAYCYLLFVLIYFPCIATLTAIFRESGSWHWTLFTALYTTGLAWCVSALVYQVFSLF